MVVLNEFDNSSLNFQINRRRTELLRRAPLKPYSTRPVLPLPVSYPFLIEGCGGINVSQSTQSVADRSTHAQNQKIV